MKVGIFSILADAEADPAIVAKHAEDLGFSSYWVPDHIILPVEYKDPYPGAPPGAPEPEYLWQMPDPLIALMRAATATTTIELGTGVLLVPERHPLHLAKEVASLDSFSGGRFHFGIGAGWCREESEILGGDFEHRWTQVKEAVQVMKGCWTEEASEHHGKYYDHPPIRSFPKPTQKPHPPIYLPSIIFGGVWAERVFRRIVQWADGWFPVVSDPQMIDDGRKQIEDFCAEYGRDPKEIRITILGGDGQYRTTEHYQALEDAGAEQLTIWLQSRTTADIQRELDGLAKNVL
ncbi:MAG: TIGR03619 family F420-dependent LLM class oxidoreductase [Gammaproteobacteria bacterium]